MKSFVRRNHTTKNFEISEILIIFYHAKKNGFRFAARQKRNPHLNPGDRKTHDCRKKTLTKLFGQRKLRINLVNVNFELHQLRF